MLRAEQPRARGELRVSLRSGIRGTELADLRQAGSLRALFPRSPTLNRHVVLTNTSGGVTGGDRFRTGITAGPDTRVSLTTQAAERAYRAQPGQTGRVETRLTAEPGARINWLPQETILFDGCALARRLTAELAPGASALIVEPLVFGRAAMGETVTSGKLDDRIELRRDGRPLYLDRIWLAGDIAGHLARPGVADGARALATVIFADPAAEAMLDRLRALLPDTAGASLLHPDLLVARILAPDSFVLRQSLIPVIDLLHGDVLPRPWMI